MKLFATSNPLLRLTCCAYGKGKNGVHLWVHLGIRGWLCVYVHTIIACARV